MATTRFILAESDLASTASLINGDTTNYGYGAFGTVEVPGAPMSNVLSPAPRSVWTIPAYSPDFTLGIDLGADTLVKALGFVGFDITTIFPVQAAIYSQMDSVGFDAVNGWTARATTYMPVSDAALGAVAFPTAFYARYLRFNFSFASFVDSPWSISKLIVANNIVDTKTNPSYGYSRTKSYPVSIVRGIDGVQSRTYLGRQRSSWALPFVNAPTTAKSAIDLALSSKHPFVYADHNNNCAYVVPIEGSFSASEKFFGMWDITAEVEEA